MGYTLLYGRSVRSYRGENRHLCVDEPVQEHPLGDTVAEVATIDTRPRPRRAVRLRRASLIRGGRRHDCFLTPCWILRTVARPTNRDHRGLGGSYLARGDATAAAGPRRRYRFAD